LNVSGLKKIMSENNITKPIWVTEAQLESEGEVVEALKGALDAGAEKVFFTGFTFGGNWRPKIGEYSEVYRGIADYCQ